MNSAIERRRMRRGVNEHTLHRNVHDVFARCIADGLGRTWEADCILCTYLYMDTPPQILGKRDRQSQPLGIIFENLILCLKHYHEEMYWMLCARKCNGDI